MLVYPTIWEGGKFNQLGPGYHYKQTSVQSIVVPEGQVVTFYKNQDRTGWKSPPFYEGTYHHLYFYGVKENPGVIHIERTKLTALDMVEIGWDIHYDPKDYSRAYPMSYKLPIGDREYKEDFKNDKIEWLRIPFGLTVEAFEHGSFKGGSLIFSGNIQGESELVNLRGYRYDRKISSIKIRADDWISAGIAIENEVITNGEKVVATTEIANNSPHLASCSKEISAQVDETVGENWNIEAGVTATVGFEAGTETIKAVGGVSVSVSGGYGEEKSTSKSKGFTDIGSVELDGFGKAKLSMIIEIGKMEADAIRKWRNKRNNAIIEQHGKISASWANKARLEIH